MRSQHEVLSTHSWLNLQTLELPVVTFGYFAVTYVSACVGVQLLTLC